ncbi:2OG-Fe(II) oxygenase [Marinimicrobium locisalis]|uniref:2OG-Fe(II) oxygenase n=1 Tax=Marinimicrobium locisalis TaxID=546022 RepID=UPI003221F718
MNNDLCENVEPSDSGFHEKNNLSTRIDAFEELNPVNEAALRSFFRELGLPGYVDEVLKPTLSMGDAQVYVAVRDRPWPPWGLGARQFSAVCLIHTVEPDSWTLSPVFVNDEDNTNVGLMAALFKEILEAIAVSETAEVCYLAAEDSLLIDHIFQSYGFEREDDVFLTEKKRYFTYRANPKKLLESLRLSERSLPELLSGKFSKEALYANALYHQSVYQAAIPELRSPHVIPEIIGLARGGHAAKPAGHPGGTGTGAVAFPESGRRFAYVSLGNFLDFELDKMLDFVQSQREKFRTATVVDPETNRPVVNQDMRRAMTLNELGELEKPFVEQLKGALPGALKKMELEGFPIGDIELQLSASGDGDYYRMHTDTDEHSTRKLSFVYFFHSEPKRFYGGELRLFDNRNVEGKAHAECSQLVTPRQNTLVIFPSDMPHELLPVRVPSKEFADSRFTLNGWVHEAR